MQRLIKRSVSSIFLMQSLSGRAYAHTIASQPLPKYVPVPVELELGTVIVIHRHGDRAQISRILGGAYPESETLAAQWQEKLPTERSRRAMMLAAHPGENLVLKGDLEVDVVSTLYSGWDKVNIPYAQLTEVGCSELQMVGRELRQRYVESGFLPPDLAQAAGAVYARSTSMCRTQQSVRSLLAGLFAVDPDAHPAPTAKNPSGLGAPRIFTQERNLETMYPTADGPSGGMLERRAVVLPAGLVARSIPGYGPFEERMRELCGFEEKVNMMQVKEVLTCHASHNIQHVRGWTLEDTHKASEITGFIWGALYKDDALNRLAIGRFLHDLRADLTAAMTGQPESSLDSTEGEAPSPLGKRLLIYSGHDSTLVPVLCALGIYDDVWPPYASFLTLEFASERSGDSSGSEGDVCERAQFVRVLYNNEERRILGEGEWCPLPLLYARMDRMSISRAQYVLEAAQHERKQGEAGSEGKAEAAALEREARAEIAATIDGGPR
ncbi:histidine phosphatase superfamily [Ochromonadaceae sp. CCMP2298]|nr:histidine phosphatase superfamily [Ochromonadaceae sp. CCMP2298]